MIKPVHQSAAGPLAAGSPGCRQFMSLQSVRPSLSASCTPPSTGSPETLLIHSSTYKYLTSAPIYTSPQHLYIPHLSTYIYLTSAPIYTSPHSPTRRRRARAPGDYARGTVELHSGRGGGEMLMLHYCAGKGGGALHTAALKRGIKVLANDE